MDIVARLNREAMHTGYTPHKPWDLMVDAATEIDRLRAEVADLTQQLAAAKEYAERLREALEEVSGLINESSGVYGLHLNGDPSPWEELLPGGKFEWLASFDEAIALPKPWGKA